MKLFKAALLVLLCVLLSGLPAQARQAMGVHAKVVDGILFLTDNSGSMMMTHKATGTQKIEMAKQAMARINAKIPGLAYQGGMMLVAPNKTVIQPAAWNRAEWAKTINAISNSAAIYGRLTPLEKSLGGVSPTLNQLPPRTAVVLFSDGYENLGGDPVAAVQSWYATNPGAVLHIVSVADSAAGLKDLKALASLNKASVLVDARDIINTEEAALDFARTVFYNETIPNQEVVSLHEVLFQVGKFVIQPKYAKQLDQLAAVMVTRPELKIFIEGYADPSGNVVANQKLSENRANAVKNYLMSKGVKDSHLIVKGRGETDRYPSYLLDRRVEIMIITQ